jgi:predicted ATP-dependent Lon-type protease
VLKDQGANVMRKIYVSDSGNDKDDGLSAKTPIRSWQRFIQLCEGNDEIIIMGNADTGKMRLIAEIDKKARVAQGGIAPKAS